MNEPKLLREILPLTEDPIREVEQLLEERTNSDIQLLKEAGLFRDSQPVKIQEKNEKVLKLAVNNVYTTTQLSRLALRYDMKLLLTKEYKGAVPGIVASEIRKWADAKRDMAKSVGDCYSGLNLAELRVFAPRHMFKKTLIDLSDPVLLYPVGEDVYEYVINWGNDFTWKRRVTSFIKLFNPFPVAEFGSFVVISMLGVAAVLYILLYVLPIPWLTNLHTLELSSACYWMFWIIILYNDRKSMFSTADVTVKT